MSFVLATVLALSLAAPQAGGYFPGLERPEAGRVTVGKTDGPVFLIVVDALRPDRLDAYGFERETAPNLRALADEGFIFTNFFANGNWTRPSTATILTGLLPHEHGVEAQADRLPADLETFPERLAKAGVPTGAVVGNGNAGGAFGLGRGFSFYADTVGHWDGLPSAAQVIDTGMPFIEKHAGNPFFLMLFMVDPHDPYHAPGHYENLFVKDTSVRLVRTPHWEIGKYSPAEVERMKATYDGAVRYTDSQLGLFFEKLKRLGIYDQSTIIVTADHGEAFGEHGYFLHSHHLYDEIVRVPLIMKLPRATGVGTYVEKLHDTTDLAPTITGLFGLPVKEGGSGVDLVSHIKTPSLSDPDRRIVTAFNHFGIRRWAVRTYDRKVIFHERADEKEFRATVGRPSLLPSVSFDKESLLFFDIRTDPFEQRDLFADRRSVKSGWLKLLEEIQRGGRQALRERVRTGDLDPETRRDLKALGYID